PHTDFYAIAKEKYFSETKKYLSARSEIKGTQYFNLYPTFARRPWFDGFDLDRAEIATISRIRSNHYNLNYSLHRCGLVPHPRCHCGLSRQDINHILWSCPLYECHRAPMLQSLRETLKSP
ncbi:hypothetical protein EAG_12796, partial [Camponotus floridanus]